MNDLDYDPCEDCPNYCDNWDMMFCCTLCQAQNGDVDCEGCNPYDI